MNVNCGFWQDAEAGKKFGVSGPEVNLTETTQADVVMVTGCRRAEPEIFTLNAGPPSAFDQPGLRAVVLLSVWPVGQDVINFRHYVRRHLWKNLGEKRNTWRGRSRKQWESQVCVLTCMAPRFSVSCSRLDVPRRTELTPSFLRHQAGQRHRLKFTQCIQDGALHLIIVRKFFQTTIKRHILNYDHRCNSGRNVTKHLKR